MLPVIKGKDLVAFLETLGFVVIRQRGSHIRMKSEDGRDTTVPLHSGEEVPKGLLRKIIREDLEMTLEDFMEANRFDFNAGRAASVYTTWHFSECTPIYRTGQEWEHVHTVLNRTWNVYPFSNTFLPVLRV